MIQLSGKTAAIARSMGAVIAVAYGLGVVFKVIPDGLAENVASQVTTFSVLFAAWFTPSPVVRTSAPESKQ